MGNPNIIALVFSDGASSGMVREVIHAVGCPISYETSIGAFSPATLAESGASIVIVDMGSDSDAESIFDLLDDDRYRVIVNDAEVTSALTGWDHARWARHLAAKILDLPGVVDPPRPEEAPIVAVDAIAPMKSGSPTESRGSDASSDRPFSSGSEPAIDDWLSEVMQVKDPGGLFAESISQSQGVGGDIVGMYGTSGAQVAASESNRKTDSQAVLPTEEILAARQPATFPMPAAAIGFAATNGWSSGHLAHSLELTPLELAVVTPLFDSQQLEPAEVLVVDVLATPATVSRVIVLCASVGGPEAIRVLLGAIPADHPALFLVVQQVGEEFLDLLSQQLRRATALRVRSADLGDQLRDGEVIPVSPKQRLIIDRSGRVTLNQRIDEACATPMNQVLRDVSDQFGEDCIAVVLSGVASDAAEGCRYVAERGGHVCAQVPASCVSSGMVEQVQQTGVVSFLGTPTELAAHLLLDRR